MFEVQFGVHSVVLYNWSITSTVSSVSEHMNNPSIAGAEPQKPKLGCQRERGDGYQWKKGHPAQVCSLYYLCYSRKRENCSTRVCRGLRYSSQMMGTWSGGHGKGWHTWLSHSSSGSSLGWANVIPEHTCGSACHLFLSASDCGCFLILEFFINQF